jgi:hypothetical protein
LMSPTIEGAKLKMVTELKNVDLRRRFVTELCNESKSKKRKECKIESQSDVDCSIIPDTKRQKCKMEAQTCTESSIVASSIELLPKAEVDIIRKHYEIATKTDCNVRTQQGIENVIETFKHIEELPVFCSDIVRYAGKKVISDIDCNRGIQAEENTLKLFEETINSSQNSFSRVLDFEKSQNRVKLYGKCDGIDIASGMLVEIKNRRHHVFNKAHLKEVVQMHAYMFLSNTDKCKFLETSKVDIYETYEEIIEFDTSLWSKVLVKLDSAITKIENILALDHVRNL